MKAIINTKLLLEDSIIFDGAITFEHGRIIRLGKQSEGFIPEDAEIIDAHGLYTAPGLIDIHTHGSSSQYAYLDPIGCAKTFVRHGVTTYLPTFYCNLTLEQMLEGLVRVKAAQKDAVGKTVAGIYMEGPYMGGFGSNQKFIRWAGDIEREEYAELLEQMADTVKIWAIDPARDGIDRFLRDAKAVNPAVVFALGHSHATSEQCRRVENFGLKLQTHHGDSGTIPGKAQGTIGAGCDEYTLYHPDMYAELICDENGIHVVPDRLKFALRTKGIEKIILITDCMPVTGDYKNNEADGIAWGPDLNYDYEGHLAGSHLTMENACRNLMSHTGCGICQAVRMASLNPAKLLGMENEIGSLAAGKKANLILIDDTVRVKHVYLEGEEVYESAAGASV